MKEKELIRSRKDPRMMKREAERQNKIMRESLESKLISLIINKLLAVVLYLV